MLKKLFRYWLTVPAFLGFVSFSNPALALPSDCYVILSGTLTFAQLQSAIDGAPISSQTKICFAPNTTILNEATATSEAIRIKKNNIKFYADPNSHVSIQNLRTVASGLWKNTAIVLQDKHYGFSVENLTIETAGDYGMGIFVSDSQVDYIKNINIITRGRYVSGLRLESTAIASYRSAINTIDGLEFNPAGQYATGINVTRGVDIKEANNIRMTFPAWTYSDRAIVAFSTKIGSMRNWQLLNASMFFGDNSEIGEFSDINFTGNSSSALFVADSHIGLMQRVTSSFTGSPSRTTAFFLTSTSVGGIRKLQVNGYHSLANPLAVYSGRAGYISNIKNNSVCAKPSLLGSTLEEPYAGC